MKIRIGTIVTAFVAVAAVVFVAGTGAVSAAKNPNTLSVVLDDYPGPGSVTYGKDVGSTLTVSNPGNNPWNKVLVTAPAPTTKSGSETFTSTLAYTNAGSACPSSTVTTTSVVCDVGTLDPNNAEVVKVIVVWTVPTAGTSAGCAPTPSPCLVNTITASGNEGTVDGPPASHTDTFVRTVKTPLIDSPDTDKEKAATYALAACNNPASPTLTTNPAVDKNHGISTAVCAPIPAGPADDPGLSVVVTETAKSTGPGKTEVSQICIPAPGNRCSTAGYTPFTFGSFATFVFTVSNKSFTGQLTTVLYDGTEDGVDNFVPVSTSPTANPHLVGNFVVDNQAQTTTFVVAGLQNGRYTGG
jgi:hypothetical protein